MGTLRWAALVLTALFASTALVAACSSSPSSSQSPSQRSRTLDDEAPASPPASEVEPTATPAPVLFDPPLDPSLVINEASELDSLIGAADELTAKAITQALLAEGLDLTGMEFFVFALPSGKGNMLVLDFETALETMVADSNAANTAPDLEEIMKHLVTSMAYEDAGVERFVLNLRYLSAQNDAELLVTMTLPNSSLVDWVTGAITQEEVLGEMDIEVSQVTPQ